MGTDESYVLVAIGEVGVEAGAEPGAQGEARDTTQMLTLEEVHLPARTVSHEVGEDGVVPEAVRPVGGARRVGARAPPVYLVADAPPQGGVEMVAEQHVEFSHIECGHGRAEVYHGVSHRRQVSLVGGPGPAALLTDRPRHVQQRIEETPLSF